jgi:hypothetical protein
MKRFIDLKIGDEFYYVEKGKTDIHNIKVVKISKDELNTGVKIGYDLCVIRENINQKSAFFNQYSTTYTFFANKSEALKYSKSQALRELRKLKNDALSAIEKVKDFRLKYYEELNSVWIDKSILELERIEKESLK